MVLEHIIERIESRRKELQDSHAILEIIDYGAGKPEDKRTKEQMQEGVCVQVPLAQMASIGVKPDKATQIAEIFAQIKPQRILELGTCCGFSSSYMSLLAPSATIDTIEGAPSLADVARNNHSILGCANITIHIGRFDVVLPNLLKSHAPFDFVFVDGHHDQQATLSYYTQILPFVRGGGAMCFDDIAWSEGMRTAWAEIAQKHKHTDYDRMGAIWL